jgi:PAS domain S-box-containing protein
MAGSLLSAVASLSATGVESRRTLILNSYHRQYPWTEAQVAAAEEVLSRDVRGIEIYAEYMDTRRIGGAEHIEMLRREFASKYRNLRPDVVLATDDDALKFLVAHDDELFGGAPVVFCGVNDLRGSLPPGKSNFTGVLEGSEIGATLNVALRQNPAANKVFIIVDDTPTGAGCRNDAATVLRRYPHLKVEFLRGEDYSHAELLQKLDTLPGDSFILLMPWFRDRLGHYISLAEGTQAISTHAPAPVYGVIDGHLGHGIVGGKLHNAATQGRTAAEMAVRILRGASPSDIPIERNVTNPYMFDYEQLARWGIPASTLPSGSVVINGPPFFQGLDRRHHWIVGVVGAALAGILGIFLAYAWARRRRMATLRQNEDRFRLLFEGSPLAYHALDERGRLLDVNQAWLDLLGYTRQEVIGRRLGEFLTPEAKRQFKEKYPGFKECRETCLAEFEMAHKGGSTVLAAFHSRSLHDAGGGFLRTHCIVRDITEQKRADDSLCLEQTRLESLLALHRMADASIQDIADFTLQSAVELTRSERGYLAFVSEDETVLTLHSWITSATDQCRIINRPIALPVETTGLWEDAVRERKPVVVNDTTLPSPLWQEGSNGHLLPGRRMTVPVLDGNRLVAVVGVGNKRQEYDEFDVCQLTLLIQGMWALVARKRTEEQRTSYVTGLEEANHNLEKYSFAAQAASKAKSEFLANMSHEIRTPMTAILGFAELIRSEGDITKAPPQRIEAIDTVIRNANHLLALLNDILDLSKIEAGKLEVERIPCSPVELLNDVNSLMRVRANAKDIALSVEYEGPAPEMIHSDPNRLRQILLNLVGNAVKFTQNGSIRIVCRLQQRFSREPLLEFDVIDTGVGMTPEQAAIIFAPFTQADVSTSRHFGGTGLGLSISRRLAQLLGGDITVQSRPGGGSTFTVTVATGPLEAMSTLGRPFVAENQPGHDPGAMSESPTQLDCHVLLAEDGADNRYLVSYLLEKAGAKVTAVENGRLACDRVLAPGPNGETLDTNSRGPFDVILMDMQMPVMDGYEATRQLRAAGYMGPIIALTANAMKKDRQKCLDAGCDEYLAKPLDHKQLLETVARYGARQTEESVRGGR